MLCGIQVEDQRGRKTAEAPSATTRAPWHYSALVPSDVMERAASAG